MKVVLSIIVIRRFLINCYRYNFIVLGKHILHLKVKLTVDGEIGKVGPDKNLQLFQDLERFESVSVLEVGGRDVESEEELNLGQFSNKLVEIVGSTFGQF